MKESKRQRACYLNGLGVECANDDRYGNVRGRVAHAWRMLAAFDGALLISITYLTLVGSQWALLNCMAGLPAIGVLTYWAADSIDELLLLRRFRLYRKAIGDRSSVMPLHLSAMTGVSEAMIDVDVYSLVCYGLLPYAHYSSDRTVLYLTR